MGDIGGLCDGGGGGGELTAKKHKTLVTANFNLFFCVTVAKSCGHKFNPFL